MLWACGAQPAVEPLFVVILLLVGFAVELIVAISFGRFCLWCLLWTVLLVVLLFLVCPRMRA